jgi:hypothetical protein
MYKEDNDKESELESALHCMLSATRQQNCAQQLYSNQGLLFLRMSVMSSHCCAPHS